MPSPAEKRRYYRHPIGVPILFEQAETHDYEKSSSLDLSEGGISFLASHALPKGTSIHLSIPIENELFKIDGKVAYCMKTSDGLYRTGVIFMDRMSAFRAKLAEEILKIKEYRKKRSEQLGREMSEEEAALEWIKKYAKSFGELF